MALTEIGHVDESEEMRGVSTCVSSAFRPARSASNTMPDTGRSVRTCSASAQRRAGARRRVER